MRNITPKVRSTINNFAKIEHSIFQKESIFDTIEHTIVPIKHIIDRPQTTYWNVLNGGCNPTHHPAKKNIGHAKSNAISQPLDVRTISPRLDFTNAII